MRLPTTVPRRSREISSPLTAGHPKPNQEPECLDPRSTSPEPLAFLLPERREKFIFKAAGLGRVGARDAVMIDYRSVKPEEPKVEWKEECVSIDLPGRARGRIWADPETSEILRLDEGVIGLVDITVPRKQQRPGGPTYMTIERADSTIRYRRVSFTDPDESSRPAQQHRNHLDRQKFGQPENPHHAVFHQLPSVRHRLPPRPVKEREKIAGCGQRNGAEMSMRRSWAVGGALACSRQRWWRHKVSAARRRRRCVRLPPRRRRPRRRIRTGKRRRLRGDIPILKASGRATTCAAFR